MALLFPPTDTLVDAGSASEIDNLFNGGGTVTVWANPVNYGESQAGVLVCKSQGASTNGWTISIDGPNTSFRFSHGSTGSGLGTFRTPPGSCPLDTWTHFAVVWDATPGAVPLLYVNGLPVAVETVTAFNTNPNDAASILLMGDRGNGDRTYTGSICDVRLYDEALSEGQVAAIGNSRGTDAIVKGLVRRFPMGPHHEGESPTSPFKGIDFGLSSTATATVPRPPNLEDGDLVVLVAAHSGQAFNDPQFNTPAGFTAQVSSRAADAGIFDTTLPRVTVFTKIASGEPATYTVSAPGAGDVLVASMAYARVQPTNLGDQTSSGNSTTATAPSISPGQNALLIRGVVVNTQNGLGTDYRVMAPSGEMGRCYREFGSGGAGASLIVSDMVVGPGATGTGNFALRATLEWGTFSLALAYDEGPNGLPVKDVSEFRADANTAGPIVFVGSPIDTAEC